MGRPRELRTRHTIKDTHKNRDRHPILRRSLVTEQSRMSRLSAVLSIALPGQFGLYGSGPSATYFQRCNRLRAFSSMLLCSTTTTSTPLALKASYAKPMSADVPTSAGTILSSIARPAASISFRCG
jgi:hypothetical protein